MSAGFGLVRRGVTSIKKLAGTAIAGDVTLSEGAGVTLTVVGQNIAIAAVGGAGVPATTVTDETTYAVAKAVGVSTNYAREDHTHGSEPHDAHASTTGITATDHHVAPAAGPDADITVDVAGAAGTASTFARSGHGHKVATSATNALAVGTAAAGTSGHSPSRDDHVHPTGAGTPSTQAFSDAAATGTGPAASMTDHKHAMPAHAAGTAGHPQPATTVTDETTYGVAKVVGTATTYSREDHTHGSPALGATGATAAAGNDARLSDARTPLAHHATHEVNGSDPTVVATGKYATGTLLVPTGQWAMFAKNLTLTTTQTVTVQGTGSLIGGWR